MSSADRSDASSSTAQARLLTSPASRAKAVSAGTREGRDAPLRPKALRTRAMKSPRSVIQHRRGWIPAFAGMTEWAWE